MQRLGTNADRFEVVEHTADIGVRAYGRTLADAYAQTARGMYSLMTDLGTVRPAEERKLEVAAPDRESLLTEWLLELLYLTESEGLLFSRFTVEIDEAAGPASHDGPAPPLMLRATVSGEPLDATRHEFGLEIKAVTWHRLEVSESTRGYQTQVIFDV
jgi:SHS2 domain-containing protein